MCHIRPGSSRLFVDDISNQRVIIFEGRHPAPRRLFQPVSNAARREFKGIDIDCNHIETTRRRVEEVLPTT
jgi:hypothetical protein